MGPETRNKIVMANLGLAHRMTRMRGLDYHDAQDARQDAAMTLMRCAEGFDAGRGFQFSTYACRAIWRQSYRDRVRLAKRYVAAGALNFDLATDPVEYDEPDPRVKMLPDLMAVLTPRERFVVLARFPQNGEPRETLCRLAELLAVTKERVRQIQWKALKKMREAAS